MALRGFRQFIREKDRDGRAYLAEQSVSKTLEFLDDGIEIVINITLSKQEQHGEAIQFLRRVADELTALERATRAQK